MSETDALFVRHPYIESTTKEPNGGNIVTSISDLEVKRVNYNNLFLGLGLQPPNPNNINSNQKVILNIPKFLLSPGMGKFVPAPKESLDDVDDKWSILDVATKKTPNGWTELFDSAYEDLVTINSYIKVQEETIGPIIPHKKDVFRVYHLCPRINVKVVIMGQDPYYTIHKGLYVANGIAYSVSNGMEIPPSLNNIFKVQEKTIPGFMKPTHGDLTNWVNQGVFLLNSSLSTMQNVPDSHKGIWSSFITKTLRAISEVNPHCIYVLWGSKAAIFEKVITSKNILKTSHPSPMSAFLGFNSCDHFNEINKILISQNMKPINWQL